MEDFKLIFYIAVAIAWVVYKNYQKVQQNRPKKVQPPAMNTEPLSDKKTLADLIIEKARQEKKDVIRKSEIKKNIKTYQKTEESKPELIDEIKKKERVTPSYLNTDMALENFVKVKDTKNKMESNTEIKKDSEEDLFDLKKFDIRTAIIYSEILKRPYV